MFISTGSMPHYLIPTSRELVRINPDKLVCVVASGNYSTIYHVEDCVRSGNSPAGDLTPYDGGPKIVLMQLGQIEDAISRRFKRDDQHFIRVGNSLIVNVDYIFSIDLDKMQLELSDNATFHVCRKASVRALQQVKDYLEQKEDILREDYKRTKK